MGCTEPTSDQCCGAALGTCCPVAPTLAALQVLDHSTEPPSARTLAVLRDPTKSQRGVQYLSWHPDGMHKVRLCKQEGIWNGHSALLLQAK